MLYSRGIFDYIPNNQDNLIHTFIAFFESFPHENGKVNGN